MTLYAALRESGWTQDWISAAFSTAKQRAMPGRPGQMSIPALQQAAPVQAPVQPAVQPQPQIETPAYQQPQSRPLVSPVQQQLPKTRRNNSSLSSIKGLIKTLLIVIAVLGIVVLALGVYRTIHGMQHQAAQRVVRDADRREDLSVLLSNLSDYYLTHHSYPTRTQLNTANFLRENGFSQDSITDPKWKASVEACTKDKQPTLAGVTGPDCYAYEVKTAQNGICNNGSTPCTKVKVSIWLEVDKQVYSVIFDKNSQAN